jgi:hypothetical protein
MPEGVPVSRQFFLVTQKGNFVVDWGNNIYQDVYSGEKVELEETDFTYMVKDDELMMLKQNKVICDFDQYTVFIYPMRDVLDSSIED